MLNSNAGETKRRVSEIGGQNQSKNRRSCHNFWLGTKCSKIKGNTNFPPWKKGVHYLNGGIERVYPSQCHFLPAAMAKAVAAVVIMVSRSLIVIICLYLPSHLISVWSRREWVTESTCHWERESKLTTSQCVGINNLFRIIMSIEWTRTIMYTNREKTASGGQMRTRMSNPFIASKRQSYSQVYWQLPLLISRCNTKYASIIIQNKVLPMRMLKMLPTFLEIAFIRRFVWKSQASHWLCHLPLWSNSHISISSFLT